MTLLGCIQSMAKAAFLTDAEINKFSEMVKRLFDCIQVNKKPTYFIVITVCLGGFL